MLLDRSVFLQVCLLLTLTQCNCQDYESNYGVDESDDHSDVQEDSGHPDYSKYYSVDTSAPLVSAQGSPEAGGFTSPIEFSGFFSPSSLEFGASDKREVVKNPFVPEDKKGVGFLTNKEQFPEFYSGSTYPIDYFEEAQKEQRKENQEDEDSFEPGPNYISHQIPAKLKADYSSDVETIDAKPLKQKKSKKSRKNYDYEDPDKEGTAEAEKYKTPDYSYEYEPSSGKYADYNVGKSSSTVSQQPQAPGYYEKLTQKPTASPYQKFSFQPVTEAEEGFKSKYLGSLISTVAPFNPAYTKIASTAVPTIETQSSENIPSHLKDKNCRRVRKSIPGNEHSRRKREAMNCFVCEDAANNAKYTQCSYAVEPEPQNDYSGVSERYSTPSKQPDGFRYKRYSGDEKNVDPYEYIKSRSQKSYDEAQESRDYDDYKIPEFYTDTSGDDKSYSEIQSAAITKNPANCHKEESEGMTCTICKDPKTGGNFEQCSYTSEPKAQKYAYVTEKKYDSNDDEPEEGSESKTAVQTKLVKDGKDGQDEKSKYKESQEHKPVSLPSNENSKYSKLEEFQPAEEYKANYRGHDKFRLSDEYNSSPEKSKSSRNSKKEDYNPSENYQGQQGGDRTSKKLIDDEPYDIPKHFAESTIKEQKTGVRGLEPSLYGSSDSSEVEGDDADSSSQAEPYKDIDEYHFKLFPEFSKEESQQAEVVANNPSADGTRKDVEEVLAEFSKKDRSACKKAEKNGMTCYLCVDKKGIQHEECMYISESKPQASHVAYHEVKQIKSPKNENNDQQEQDPAATELKRKHFFKKVSTTPTPFSLEAAASEEIETKIRYNPTKNRRRNAKKAKEPARAASNHDAERLSEDDETKAPPVEFVVGDEEGAYSAETKPVYSKALGVKLPLYMIEKSEFEKEFDEFSGNH